jgi:hypothetical protein
MPDVTIVGPIEPELRGDLRIYRVRSVQPDRETVRGIGARFGLRGDIEFGAFSENRTRIAYAEGAWALTVFRASSGWRYRDTHRWQVDDGSADLRIADGEAIAAARSLVERHELASLEELRPLRVTRLHVAHAERGSQESNERIIDVGVAFQRLLDGLPVEGPGGKTVIYLDQDRELTGIDHLWREIEGVERPVSALRPPDYAFEMVRRRYGAPGPGRVEVTGMTLGHFEMGWDDQQEYLQPAYVVFLRLVSGDERFTMNSVYAVAAAEDPAGELEPEPPSSAPQSQRG